MRRVTLLLIVLQSCANAAAPASRPAAASAPTTLTVHTEAPALPQKPLPPLDDKGQRELLAGFELVLGDERGKTAACLKEKNQLGEALAQEKASSTLKPALIGGAVGVAIGAVIMACVLGLAR